MSVEDDQYWQQESLQIQKPSMKQLLNQRFSCEILFNLLSSGEKCIYKDNKKRKYRYYDPLTTSDYKNDDELEIEFRNQLRCFQATFLDDLQNNGGFRYPDNLDKKDIMIDIYNWIEIAKNKNRTLLVQTYIKFLKLLGGEKIIVDKIKIEETKKKKKIGKANYKENPDVDMKQLLNAAMVSNKESYDMEDKIKEDYLNGNYSIIAKLYCDRPKEKTKWKKFKEFFGYYDDEKEMDDLK